jgi:DNA-binding NarL/FixJ family response regulator
VLKKARPIAGLHVAIVADNKFERGLAVELLRSVGITNISQFDVPDLALHLRPLPDVVLWIWALRDYSQLRKLTRQCRSSRIIVSDSAPSPEMLALALDAGAASVLSRPYSIRDLISHISRVAADPATLKEIVAT